MPVRGEGEVFIKIAGTWYDAFTNWGVTFDSTSLSNLMAPVPLKEMIENKSALEHGKRVIRTGRKKDERTLTLSFNIRANTKTEFMTKYAAFCENVLAAGKIDLKSVYQSGVVYHLDYLSCQSFKEYVRELGKFSLRVVEPNPGNRTDS